MALKKACAALILLCGCAADHAPRGRTATPDGVTCTGPAPTYVVDVKPVLERRCLTCHAPGGEAGDEHDFTRFDVLHGQRQALVANVESRTMPPPGQPALDPSEASVLVRWGACAARER